MSTVSSASAMAFTSPKQRLLDSITSQVSAGKISSTDETALDSAVESIDSALSSGSGRSSASAKLGPSDMKSRIDDLISQQVGSGTLTSDQAETLKQVFAQGSEGHGGKGGHGEVGRSGGPPPGPPPADDTAPSDPFADPSTSASGSTTGQSAGDILASFMKQLQSAQNQPSGYGANATSGGSRSASALLLNFEA
ncbi:hypothetical protein [Methylobacterium haplocladii]|uniref:Uncharacterized protein n=1 Tax=Methylobacterium haplocladii TaxID=1176176 RepID=A0A512IMW5_9HYPH|nr:hypothetical protein [Methylobacterium haplocladii]GEO99018.1 hypothetical protein MHA02_14060 [Methylobacterium haplocladii]GJD84135.1 hypothetical protein HPGCJGGD_2010 [Methylobacterium haplocladii]GLS58982.1 hypothetical protein GCM10007887_16480 [Methylobacterium haplocladii]